MTITLGRNIAAIRTERYLDRASGELSSSFERLSSGMRINRASDDAAGLSIADSLRVDARLRNTALRNVNDGISMLSIMDGTLQNQSEILTRLSELAEESANGSYSDAQRVALSHEYQQLVSEFGRLGDGTTFNKIKPLLAGRGGSTNYISFQGGVTGASSSVLNMTLKDFGTRSGVLNFDAMPSTGSDLPSTAGGVIRNSIDELSTFYGGQMIATTVNVGGKSIDIMIGFHEDDLLFANGKIYQGIRLDLFARNSDVGFTQPDNWSQLGGTVPIIYFDQQTGEVSSYSAGTVTGLAAGDFNFQNFDISGLKLSSLFNTHGLPNNTTQYPSLLELTGVETKTRARNALDLIRTKMSEVASYRGSVGAMQSRLKTTASLLASSREQSLAAESRIRDIDVAAESANLISAQIRQRAAAAILSNTRSQQDLVLMLLR